MKDVTFEEDASKIRTNNAPQNMSTIKNIAINILRKNEYENMAQAMRLVSNNICLIKNMNGFLVDCFVLEVFLLL